MHFISSPDRRFPNPPTFTCTIPHRIFWAGIPPPAAHLKLHDVVGVHVPHQRCKQMLK